MKLTSNAAGNQRRASTYLQQTPQFMSSTTSGRGLNQVTTTGGGGVSPVAAAVAGGGVGDVLNDQDHLERASLHERKQAIDHLKSVTGRDCRFFFLSIETFFCFFSFFFFKLFVQTVSAGTRIFSHALLILSARHIQISQSLLINLLPRPATRFLLTTTSPYVFFPSKRGGSLIQLTGKTEKKRVIESK